MLHTKQQRAVRAWMRGVVSSMILYTIVLIPQIHAQTNEAVIYLDSLRQVIKGFGAANISLFGRPDMTDSEIETAFGTGEGQLGFAILRLGIQTNSSQWGINLHTGKKAYDKGVKIIASPWSPPASMKTNNSTIGGELKESSYADYAGHLNAFADYMAANGAPLYAISIQNEPDVTVTYESCNWSPSQMLKFMRENASAIGTRVMAPESFQFRRAMSDPILNDSLASANLDIVAGHIYGGGLARYPLAEEKGKEVWMTEYLINSINDCMNADMSAYVWWYIVRYYGPISGGTNNSGSKGDVTRKGFVMSQFARFVRPGYMRVLSTIPRGSVYVTAYKPVLPGSSSNPKFVIVAVNMGSTTVEQTFRVENLVGGTATVKPYVTSGTKNCEQQSDIITSNGSFTATLDDSSVTTFVADVVSGTQEITMLPQTFKLSQNYPNPFNPTTKIRYSVPSLTGRDLVSNGVRDGQIPEVSQVTLKVYDLLGRDVATLVNEQKVPGSYVVTFDAGDFSSGVYFYSFRAGNHYAVRKMILMK
jgi:glucuronoarabinoxylan endo-1,4-beta-xylanase